MKVLDHGHVLLLDTMGTDESIAMDARTSYDKRQPGEDRRLIRRLMRDRHTSPFEMGVMKFEIKCPIFVARQLVRHRTASMNEVSARYTQLPEEMYIPEQFEEQSSTNKQGRGELLPDQDSIGDMIYSHHHRSYTLYQNMIDAGVAREIARGILPVNIYTKFVWKMDLHNLMHFLKLRLDPHAQWEIRMFADAVATFVKEKFPVCWEAFTDYVLLAKTVSVYEKNILRGLLRRSNPEQDANVYKKYVEGGLMTEAEWKDFVTSFGLMLDD